MKVKYPKGETVWVSYYNSNHELLFILTSKHLRDYYFLYEVVDGENLNKLGRATNPIELEKKYNIYERLTTKRKR